MGRATGEFCLVSPSRSIRRVEAVKQLRIKPSKVCLSISDIVLCVCAEKEKKSFGCWSESHVIRSPAAFWETHDMKGFALLLPEHYTIHFIDMHGAESQCGAQVSHTGEEGEKWGGSRAAHPHHYLSSGEIVPFCRSGLGEVSWAETPNRCRFVFFTGCHWKCMLRGDCGIFMSLADDSRNLGLAVCGTSREPFILSATHLTCVLVMAKGSAGSNLVRSDMWYVHN